MNLVVETTHSSDVRRTGGRIRMENCKDNAVHFLHFWNCLNK